MMYVREPDKLLSYFIEALKAAKPSKIILIVDYVSERFPCLNFETSFDLAGIEEIVLITQNQYLKETIYNS